MPRKHPYTLVCRYCQRKFGSDRPHTKTCSVQCRKALSRWKIANPLLASSEALYSVKKGGC